MAPPAQLLNLDVEAISGICGSVSIACWVVVFSPQILENFRRGNADGLSLQFLIVWLAGDVFNILGAVLQGVLPTMIILAIYYTIADIVLLGQCFYYRGFTWRDEVIPPAPKAHGNGHGAPTTNGHLAASTHSHNHHPAITATAPTPTTPTGPLDEPSERTTLLQLAAAIDGRGSGPSSRRGSDWSLHLAPTVSLVSSAPPPPTPSRPPRPSALRTTALNALAVFMVVGAGVAGWLVSEARSAPSSGAGGGDGGGRRGRQDDVLRFNTLGQVFGWLCAALYLGSRLPQLLLNWRRKSTEGVSLLFFLFACLGNLTYVLSICAFEPACGGDGGDGNSREAKCGPGEAAAIYGRYILVNLSWIAGSLGTLLLDLGIFVQFFMYNKTEEEEYRYEDEAADGLDGSDEAVV